MKDPERGDSVRVFSVSWSVDEEEAEDGSTSIGTANAITEAMSSRNSTTAVTTENAEEGKNRRGKGGGEEEEIEGEGNNDAVASVPAVPSTTQKDSLLDPKTEATGCLSPSTAAGEAKSMAQDEYLQMIYPPTKEGDTRMKSNDVDSILDNPETIDWISSPSKKKEEKDHLNRCQYQRQTQNSQEEEEQEDREQEDLPTLTQPPTANIQPGAYAGSPGRSLCRRDGNILPVSQHNSLDQQQQDPSTTISTLPDVDNSDHHGDDQLVEALPVQSTIFSRSSRWMRALPVDVEDLDEQHATREAKENKYKIIACGIVAIASLVLIVSLSVRLTRKNKSSNDFAVETETPTPSPTRILPPMENLELLYDGLPERTKESLYNNDSPQYQAWEWLLHHPNITAYPTWRKKQIFAMATIFYSFEGPNWPEGTPAGNRWMDVSTSECSWIMTNEEKYYYYHQSINLVGRDAYEEQDWQPCNKNGEIQLFALNRVFLPSNFHPSIPPEIGFLTSLKLLGLAFAGLNTKLSSLISTELLQLPSLEGITLSNNGATGAIPGKTLGMLTGLRHLLINANKLTGTIPSDIALMSSLEYLNLGDDMGLTGRLPSELWLMTRLTGLEIYRSSVTGTIPTELASLTRVRELSLDGNLLMSGTVPSTLGLLTAITALKLYENRLTGSIPTELGLMTNTLHLRLWNNALTGSIPSELGLMTNIIDIRLGNDLTETGPYNNFSGFLPTALWGLSHMKELFLANLPNLRGRIPPEILMPNLTLLSLSGSQLTGTIPDQVCIFVEELYFDCSDLLCGCDCPCAVNKTNVP